jgi:uncharacterized membrane protein YqjE
MPEQTPAASRPTGFFGHAMAWLALFVAHLRVRLQLAGLESREAAIHYGITLGLAVAALIVLIFGYFFFCVALAVIISWAFDGEHALAWVLLGVAVLHFGGAAGMLLAVKSKLKAPMFSATLDELRKDHEWLTKAEKLR